MLKYFSVNTIAEITCLLIATACLSRDMSRLWRSFILYLLLVCVTESAGIILRNFHMRNAALYAAFIVFECLMISLFFYHIFKRYHKSQTLLYVWLIIFLLFYLTECSLGNFKIFPAITATMMSVAFVLASLYFYLLILKDEKFRTLGTYAPFWIVNGILLYYFGSTACNVFYDYLAKNERGITPFASVRYIIFVVLNLLLYGCWSYAFICRYFQKRSYS